MLLKAGCIVDSQDRNGRTALIEAVQDGRPHLIKLLLDAGADPRHADVYGQRVIDFVDNISRTAGEAEEIEAMLKQAISDGPGNGF
jgi:ankyrin repeat protein